MTPIKEGAKPTAVRAEVLSAEESQRLQNLEEVIARGQVIQRRQAGFIEVGAALAEIRAGRLYRQSYGTFEQYCRARFKMTRMRASQLINAAEVARNVNNCLQQPTHEAQVRPLTKLEPEQQREAWSLAIAASPNPTAIEVEQALQTLKDSPSPNGRHTIKLFEVTAKMPLPALLLDLGSAYAEDACSLIEERAQTDEERQAAITLLLNDSQRISDLVRSHFSSKTETDPDATEPVSSKKQPNV